MVNALLYFLFVVGVSAAAIGYALFMVPGMSEDEARQAFWRAIGGFVSLLGSVAAGISAYFLWS